MGAYIIRRLLLIFPTLLGILIINFTLVQFVPGGPVEQILAQIEGEGDVFEAFSAADLISEETPNYQLVAGRLITYHLRKQVYGQFEPPKLIDIVKKNIKLKMYDPLLLKWYRNGEWKQMERWIDHKRDEQYTYAAMEQFRGKYLVQDRYSDKVFETPQVALMLIAATLFHRYPKETRMKWVKDFYDSVSKFEISLPTPVMAGVRTSVRQFSSCVLIESGDSLDSINATAGAIVKYVSKRAGIGI